MEEKKIDFKKIEKKWQDKWEKEKVFETEKNNKPKFYVLEMFPYPSGEGLHMGHALNYTIGDVLARFKRMKGFNVLYPMGYDALGLPAENAAIKAGTHPQDYTNKAIKNYIRQQKELGLSYDWNRVVNTASPDYYKWDQWIFLKMLEKGLAYQKEAAVNYCKKCQTVLANEQVINGKCWRHEDTDVEIKFLKQWFFKTTEYADELYKEIDGLDWPAKTKAMQKNWIGRSEGVEIDFEIVNKNETQVESVKHFRDNISIDSKLKINGKEIGIREMIKFRFDDGNYYMKLFLDNDQILADDLNTNSFVFVKEKKTDLDIREGSILFNKNKFNYLFKAHAIAEEVYGKEIFAKGEGESFWDYSSEDNDYLSLGIIDKTKKRLDFFGKILYPEDIGIVNDKVWKIFTTRPDTIFGVTFMVVSAQHPRLMELVTEKQKKEVEKFFKKIKITSQKSMKDVEELNKEGVFTGSYAVNPATNEKVPVYAGNFVVADYGSGMVMAVPAHDQRDWEFAKKYGIEIKQVVAPFYKTTSGKDAVRECKKTVERDAVFIIVKHWKENKYICLDWKEHGWKSFLMGGIESGESEEEAAKRETEEETGYSDFKLIKRIGPEVHAEFFATHKDINRYGKYKMFLVELKSGKYKKPSEEEVKNHKVVWLEPEKISNFLNLENHQLAWDILQNGDRAYTEQGKLINSKEFNGLDNEEAKEKITKWLAGMRKAKKVINFKLRDWLISRQRYWGTPIPIIYCDKCGAVPINEKDLPVKLPREVKFGKGNPLLTNEKWIKAKCPKCSGIGRRETDTMDTFVNSSWYYLKYTDSKNDKKIFDSGKANYWCPVDQYIGGAEHATLHLIYIRFYTKFLADLKLINFREPAKKLFHQGMLAGEGGVKMSKSKGNAINPDEVSEKYGIDTARYFLLSLASPDKPRDWSEKGIQGSMRFINKIFRTFESIKIGKESLEIEKRINKAIKEVGEEYDNFDYRTATIKLKELFDKLSEEKEVSKETLEKSLKLLSPLCPHIAEELWGRLGNKKIICQEKWPEAKEMEMEMEKQDINNKIINYAKDILKKIKEKQKVKKIYLYVLPFEIKEIDKKKISKELGDAEIFAVNDSGKYDPENKSKKARPGMPGIYIE